MAAMIFADKSDTSGALTKEILQCGIVNLSGAKAGHKILINILIHLTLL
jgi:hypothetical protein